MHTIAIASQKGGCGKTATAINLAAEPGKLDQRTLLIDMDPQGHASLGLGVGDRSLGGLYEVFSDELSLDEAILPQALHGSRRLPASGGRPSRRPRHFRCTAAGRYPFSS